VCNEKDQNICELDIGYTRMWTFNYLVIVQNEIKVAKLIEIRPPFKVGIGIPSGIGSCMNI